MHIISRLLRMHQFRFLHDVTKIKTKKLSILLSFYFHVASPQTSFGVRGGKWMRDERTPKDVCGESNFHKVLLAQYLNTFTQTNFRFERVLRFAIEDGWISFAWRGI